MRLTLLPSFRCLTLKMLHDASETVPVGSNQHPLSLFDLGNDLLIPEGQCPGDGVFQTLTAGELVLGQVGVTAVLQRKVFAINVGLAQILLRCQLSARRHLAYGLVEGMPLIHGRGRNVKRASPDLDLGLSVFSCRFCLVQPGQATVVTLIEAPGPVDGQPHLVDAVQNEPQGADGPLQDGGVANIKFIASI